MRPPFGAESDFSSRAARGDPACNVAGTVDIDTVITRAEQGDAGSQYAFGFLYRVGRTSARVR